MSSPAATIRVWGPFLVPATLTVSAGLIGLAVPDPGPGEELTRVAAGLDPEAILRAARDTDAVNAFYYLLMHFWADLAGHDVPALRLPSLVAMGLGAGLAGELGRRVLTPGVGLRGGLFLAAVPAVSRYAQEARPFALAFLCATAATLLLYRTLDRPHWGRWAGYGLLVTLTGLLHFPALLILAGHAYTMVSRWSLSRQPALLWWLPVTVLALVPPAPLISLGMRQQAALLAWDPDLPWRTSQHPPAALLASAAALLFLLGLALAARWPDRALIRELAVLAAVPPLALAVALTLTGSFWAPHWALPALVPVALCAAAALRGLRLRAVLALLTVVALALPQHEAIRRTDAHHSPAAAPGGPGG
ncbi:glycosyltransferase family 39 protein [Actinoplanes sp. DH11]|uniref:glycosyltransferase family 39 protein n=1 Tax=Actinoplanes sp. DH11 TaxID=2857011 RepID=UPI001E5C503B|nr:glycosyltransferase family 39 protein [Actinoplanes sp. DH11]